METKNNRENFVTELWGDKQKRRERGKRGGERKTEGKSGRPGTAKKESQFRRAKSNG